MEIKQINYENDEYPKLLKNIKKPPKQLYVLGNTNLLNKPGIAIIGSRNCTQVGEKIAKNFAIKLSSVRNMHKQWNGIRNRLTSTFRSN